MRYSRYEHVPFLKIDGVERIVADVFGVSEKTLYIEARDKRIIGPRQVACWWRSKYTAESLGSIGKRYGLESHATVLHGIKQVEKKKEKDEDFALLVRVVNARIFDEIVGEAYERRHQRTIKMVDEKIEELNKKIEEFKQFNSEISLIGQKDEIKTFYLKNTK